MHGNSARTAAGDRSAASAVVRCHDVHRDRVESGNATRALVSSMSDLSRNRLLAAVPPAELERIGPFLARVPLRRRQVLQEPHLPSPYAYFIEHGAVSVLAKTKADGPIGVGLVGRFGMIGTPIVLGTMRSPLRALVQIPGEALRIGAEDLRRCMEACEALRRILLRYVQALMIQSAQLALCNTRHSTDERLARWLLLARDRMDEDDVCVTHDLLSRVLGVRRATVTEAIGRLEQAGMVRPSRGCLTILDRSGLERIACECYRIIRAEYDQMLVGGPDGLRAAGEATARASLRVVDGGSS